MGISTSGAAACPSCIPLQFDVLEMRIPPSLVDRIFVSGTEATAPPNSQYVYLVVDGNPLVCSFSGEISPALYDAILSNLKISPAP